MDGDLCLVCGASWDCEHAPSLEERGFEYVPPDAPSYRERYGARANDGTLIGSPDLGRVQFPSLSAFLRHVFTVSSAHFFIGVQPVAAAFQHVQQSVALAADQKAAALRQTAPQLGNPVSDVPAGARAPRLYDEHAEHCGCTHSHAPTYLWAIPWEPPRLRSLLPDRHPARASARAPPGAR